MTVRRRTVIARRVVEAITPERAQALLDSTRQGPREPTRVAAYADLIRRGQWSEYSSRPVLIRPTGQLHDGRHRMAAIIATGQPVRMLVGYEEERAS